MLNSEYVFSLYIASQQLPTIVDITTNPNIRSISGPIKNPLRAAFISFHLSI